MCRRVVAANDPIRAFSEQDTIRADDHRAHRHFVIHLLGPLCQRQCMAHPVLVAWSGIVHAYSHSIVAGGLPEMS